MAHLKTYPDLASFNMDALRLFNTIQPDEWKLVCPNPKCRAVHKVAEWKATGIESKQVGKKCLTCGFEDPGNLPIFVENNGTENECFAFAGQALLPKPKAKIGGGLGLF